MYLSSQCLLVSNDIQSRLGKSGHACFVLSCLLLCVAYASFVVGWYVDMLGDTETVGGQLGSWVCLFGKQCSHAGGFLLKRVVGDER